MGPGTLKIHVCARDMPVFVTPLDEVKDFYFVLNMLLHAVLQICLAFVFSDLQLLLANVEQVVDCLVVYLDIGALDLKVYCLDVLVTENCRVVQRLARTLRLSLVAS